MRFFLLLFTISLNASVVVTCPQSVKQNTTVACVASGGTGPYTYTVVSGSVGSVNSSTGVYTAPSHITPNQTWGGCQVLPNNSIFNTRIDALSVHASNTTWINAIINAPLKVASGFTIQQEVSTDPTTAMYFEVTPAVNGMLAHMPDFPPNPVKLHQENSEIYQASGDHHFVGMVKDTCVIEEMYQLFPIGWSKTCLTCNSEVGTQYTSLSFTNTPGVDAASLPILPLLLRPEELLAGVVSHAFRITYVNGSFCPGCAFIWPAQANTSGGAGAPYGARLRLKSAYSLDPSLDGLCPTAVCQAYVQTILLALKRYGAFIADVGTNGEISVSTGAITPDMQNAFTEIANNLDNHSQFEFIDESALQTSSTGVGTSSSWMETKINNGTVTPVSAAVILATDALSATGTASIALQGVSIGVPHSQETIQAGSANKQFTSQINGASNQSVTWALSPSGGNNGTITSGGLYSPPSSILGRIQTTATATSVADGTVSTTVQITILPTKNGVLYIQNGAVTADTVDANGNTWYAAHLAGAFRLFDDNQPYTPPFGRTYNITPNGVWANSSGTNPNYNYIDSNGGATLPYNLTVPNGTYILSLFFADAGLSADQLAMSMDAQNNILFPRIDPFVITGVTKTGFNKSSLITVSNGTLIFNVRSIVGVTGSVSSCCTGLLYNISPPFGALLSGISLSSVVGSSCASD